MFYVLIQSRCSNAWITLDFVLQRMDHCLQYLPKSEKRIRGVQREVHNGSISALQIKISPAESVSADESYTGIIMLYRICKIPVFIT